MADTKNSTLMRFIAGRRDLGTQTPGNIDEATFIDGEPGLILQRSGTDVPRGAPFFVRGWAVDLGRRAAPWGIRIEVDGSVVDAQVKLGDERPDVVKLIGTPAVLRCGFRAFFSTAGLTVGPHELRVRAIVGRRGSAFARLPSVARLFVNDRLPAVFAPPAGLSATTPWFRLDPVEPVAAGAVLAISGWALDSRGRPLRTVAARLGSDAWNAGWTGIRRSDLAVKGAPPAARAGFGVRVRLDSVAPGTHGFQIAGQTAAGRWIVLQPLGSLIVTFPDLPVSRWLRPLVSGGEAFITHVDGSSDAAWSALRLGTYDSRPIRGLLRRSSRPGASVTLVARSVGGGEVEIPAWSAPTGNPHVLVYGTRIDGAVLGAGKHQLFVDAPDAAGRFLGRSDTGCSVYVERSERPTDR